MVIKQSLLLNESKEKFSLLKNIRTPLLSQRANTFEGSGPFRVHLLAYSLLTNQAAQRVLQILTQISNLVLPVFITDKNKKSKPSLDVEPRQQNHQNHL